MPAFRVLTYNVHSCVGTDGKLEPGRIADVIAQSDADIVALQELDVRQTRSAGLHQPEWIAERLNMGVHFTAARPCNEGHYGNAVLSRYPLSVVTEGNLLSRRDEPRAAQWLKISLPALELNLINTHLSIHFRERMLQTDQLLGTEWLAKADVESPLVVCGDLNSGQFSLIYRKLLGSLRDAQRSNGSRAKPTWPSRWPLFRIDHVLTSQNVEVRRCEVRRDALSRVASDHLPLLAELSWRGLEP